MAGEKARRQLHKNAASNIEQVLEATPHIFFNIDTIIIVLLLYIDTTAAYCYMDALLGR